MKKVVLIRFKIFSGDKMLQLGQLPAREKARLDQIAFKAKKLIQENDCRIHGDRHQSLLISVMDGETDIQVNACCSEYAKKVEGLKWDKIMGSFSAVYPIKN